MTFLRCALILSLSCGAASAATLVPASQTLEAIHGAAVTDADKFFDGLSSRVKLVTPTEYAPLPSVPTETAPESSAAAPALAPSATIESPGAAMRETVPPSSSASSARGESSAGLWIGIALAVAAAAVLLLLLL
jgi:hypothetical protein